MKLTIKDKLTEKSFFKELETQIVEILKDHEENLARARAGVSHKSVKEVYTEIAAEIINSFK